MRDAVADCGVIRSADQRADIIAARDVGVRQADVFNRRAVDFAEQALVSVAVDFEVADDFAVAVEIAFERG